MVSPGARPLVPGMSPHGDMYAPGVRPQAGTPQVRGTFDVPNAGSPAATCKSVCRVVDGWSARWGRGGVAASIDRVAWCSGRRWAGSSSVFGSTLSCCSSTTARRAQAAGTAGGDSEGGGFDGRQNPTADDDTNQAETKTHKTATDDRHKTDRSKNENRKPRTSTDLTTRSRKAAHTCTGLCEPTPRRPVRVGSVGGAGPLSGRLSTCGANPRPVEAIETTPGHRGGRPLSPRWPPGGHHSDRGGHHSDRGGHRGGQGRSPWWPHCGHPTDHPRPARRPRRAQPSDHPRSPRWPLVGRRNPAQGRRMASVETAPVVASAAPLAAADAQLDALALTALGGEPAGAVDGAVVATGAHHPPCRTAAKPAQGGQAGAPGTWGHEAERTRRGWPSSAARPRSGPAVALGPRLAGAFGRFVVATDADRPADGTAAPLAAGRGSQPRRAVGQQPGPACGEERPPADAGPDDARVRPGAPGTETGRRGAARMIAQSTLAALAMRELLGAASSLSVTSPRTSPRHLAGVVTRHLPMCSARRGDDEQRCASLPTGTAHTTHGGSYDDDAPASLPCLPNRLHRRRYGNMKDSRNGTGGRHP